MNISMKIVMLEYNLWKGMAYFYSGLKRTVEANVGYHSNTWFLLFRYLHHMVAVQGNCESDVDNVKKFLRSNIKFELPKILMV